MGYESEEILTIDQVRFNSVCILPSELESCNIDHVDARKQYQFLVNPFIEYQLMTLSC